MVIDFLKHEAFVLHRHINNGDQYLFKFENGYGASVVNHSFSYTKGNEDFEVAILWNDHITYDTHITDDVLCYQSIDDVIDVLKKVKLLVAKVNA
ncbi:hypothetical protein AB4G91_01440 [Macrococcoides goetzii]|uniref:hypothetical protein n=1 Tax=Macrococcus sp. PK TaxID=2801919 RepID=UPI001F1035DC|nr:hypothetical protein [Macrococcus sp. PK]MCH4983960.1 hypothetical protein [Macrococcus sp. PK]